MRSLGDALWAVGSWRTWRLGELARRGDPRSGTAVDRGAMAT